jgi:hypothetical protein
MGFLKKITRPISRVLDKVIPNEIKPALPFLAAAAPFMAPGLMSLGGNTMLSRALISGGLNLGSQLAQEGSEGDFSALSLAMASGIGALSGGGPGKAIGVDSQAANNALVRSDATGASKFFADKAAGMQPGLTKSGLGALESSANYLSGVGETLRNNPFSMEGLKAAMVPVGQATTDLAIADTRRFNKQQIIDDALGALDDAADDAARASAIRLAMQQYGFTEDEITETISSAGYRAGGRVGLKGGGMDASNPDFGGIPAAMENIKEDAEEMITIMTDNGPIQIEKSVYESMPGMFMDTTTSAYGDAGRGRPVPKFADGGIMNAKRGLVDEPGGYAGEMPSIKEIWSKEGEDDPLGTIVKLGLTFRKPVVEIVKAIGVTASVAADLVTGVAKLGYDVTEPIRDVVSDVAGGIYDVGKDLVKGSKTDTRFIQPMYYLRRFGPEKNLTDEETQLAMMKDSVGRDDPKKRRELENIVFGFDDAGISQRPEDKEVSETIKFKEKYNFADGGLMNLGGKEMDMRGGGFIPIGKKERADDVPARLSKNEFVMTADAVRAAGGGSVNKGAKRMYDLMNNLEARV